LANLTAEERSYLERAEACPLEFTIPADEADAAWGRAQSFIGRFSSMKLQTVTDFVIQTYNPREGNVDFGYYVTKTPLGDQVRITVECIKGNLFSGADAKRNAHILAYYIKTGEEPSPKLIAK
jgi:hypothetical protein